MLKLALLIAFVGFGASCMGPPRAPVIPSLQVREASVAADVASKAVERIDIQCAPELSADRVAYLESYGTRQRLQNELMKQLASAGRFGHGGRLQLKLEIREFRLRSQASTFLNGAFAGADVLGVRALVTGAGVPDATFETGTSTVRGGQYEDDRLDRLVKELSRRVIAELD